MPITITLPDGSERREYDERAPLPAGVATSIGKRPGQERQLPRLVDGDEVDHRAAVVTTATTSPSSPPSTDEGRHVLRHSTAHVMAQAVTQLFPGAKFSIGPAIENGFYYDFELPDAEPRSPATISNPSTPGCVRSSSRRPAVPVRSEVSAGGGLSALFADQPYKVEIIERVQANSASAKHRLEPTTCDTGEVAIDGETISIYRNSDDFVDLCKRPARAVHRPARTLQVAEGGRRLLARRREAADAAAHLWHRLGVAPGARPAPAPARRGRTARSPAAGDRARPGQLPQRAGRRARGVAPQGGDHPQADRGLQQGTAPAGRLRVRVHTAPSERGPVRDLRSPAVVRREHVPADGAGQRLVLHEADELPDALPDLPCPAAQLPGAAVAPVRARHRLPLRAGGGPARAVAHPRLHPRRQSHLLHR